MRALIFFIPEDVRERTAGLLWLFAKHTCRAQRPRCAEYPLTALRDYGGKR